MVTVRIPDDLRDRIDAARPSTTSREAWVRAALEQVLDAPARKPHVTATASIGPKPAAASKPRPKTNARKKR